MDEQTFRVLEFDRVLELPAAFAATVPGRAAVRKIRPLATIGEIRSRSSVISECRRLYSLGRSFGLEHFDDLVPLFQKLVPADAVLEPLELRSFLPLFYSALNLRILGDDPSFSNLAEIVLHLATQPELRKTIESAIDKEGKIRDGASPELARIRKGIRHCEDRIKGLLEGILQQKDLALYLQDFYVAERNKRWVLPVKRDFKGHIPGIVHDISNTGETVYVEPFSVQHVGNELESLRSEEKLEEYRILRSISYVLRERLREIEDDYHIVVRVDALQAVAGFSEQMRMNPPEISETGHLRINAGRHPFLWKILRKDDRESNLVPLDVELGRGHTCMVITGSNAGGKTVALKTTGVLTLMALSGMHIPAGSGSMVPFSRKVFADIGDDQSIEQNLSTFSAHTRRISEIIAKSGDRTLVIMDELGTGTDPEQGGALSCAILKRLKQQGALTLVSTHLGMLKAFAHSEPGVTNSSMEMEEVTVNGVRTFRPTYKLVIGEPGASHALEIAESLGLQEDVIREARRYMSGEDAAIESLIIELKEKNRALDMKLREHEGLKQEADQLRLRLRDELLKMESQKKDAYSKAFSEAEGIIREAKRAAHDILETLKKSKPEEAAKVVKELDKKLDEAVLQRKQYTRERSPLKEIREGQRVFVNKFSKHGVVQSVNEKAQRGRVLIDGKEIMVPFTELSEPDAELAVTGAPVIKKPVTLPSAEMHVPSEINLVGQRVDPALSRIERYLNDASMAGLKQVKIIHGIGTGTLARAIREHLSGDPIVASYRKGNEDEGGEAVTMVFFEN